MTQYDYNPGRVLAPGADYRVTVYPAETSTHDVSSLISSAAAAVNAQGGGVVEFTGGVFTAQVGVTSDSSDGALLKTHNVFIA